MIESGSKRILFVGAHPDDIELGCGGLLSRLIRRPDIEKHYLILASREQNTGEPFDLSLQQQHQAMDILAVPRSNLTIHRMRSRFLPLHADEVRLYMAEAKKQFSPDIVLSHSIDDPNQDHRTIAEEALRVFRDVALIEYEQPGGSLSMKPNMYAELDMADLDLKVNAAACFTYESRKSYFSSDLIVALARLRGEGSKRYLLAEGYRIARASIRL